MKLARESVSAQPAISHQARSRDTGSIGYDWGCSHNPTPSPLKNESESVRLHNVCSCTCRPVNHLTFQASATNAGKAVFAVASFTRLAVFIFTPSHLFSCSKDGNTKCNTETTLCQCRCRIFLSRDLHGLDVHFAMSSFATIGNRVSAFLLAGCLFLRAFKRIGHSNQNIFYGTALMK